MSEPERVTGLAFLDRPLHAWRTTPSDSVGRRLLLAFLVAVGVTMTAFGSIFVANTPAIPYGIVPDLRFAILLSTGFFLGLHAAGGNARRRSLALWSVLGFVIAFHLEEATVHWIGPYPGSITGARVGLLGTAGSVLALLALLLMHVEVESVHLRDDLVRRGAKEASADAVAAGLRRAGQRRALALGAGVAGLGLLVAGAEQAFGNEAAGGDHVLLLGGAILVVLAFFLLRVAKPAAAEEAAEPREGPS